MAAISKAQGQSSEPEGAGLSLGSAGGSPRAVSAVLGIPPRTRGSWGSREGGGVIHGQGRSWSREAQLALKCFTME